VFDHVGIRVSDREASERFYATVLSAVGIEQTLQGETFSEWDDFNLSQAAEDKPVTRHLHIGFAAPSRDAVAEFWQAGTAAGYENDGEPGPRSEYGDDYYGAFLLDPDGNSVEAVHHDDLRRGNVDHLWIRVRNLGEAAAFYSSIARYTGLHQGTVLDERRQFRGAWGTFSLVADGRPPTQNLHMAFAVPGRGDVHRFHEAALAAGYRDHGAPREWPEYHAGYYGAFVLDPDGNNIEAVHHGVQAVSEET
jgi:catechol 2,3-dioxygenase-like lactoylglutathione lyase family enzyme